MLKIRHRCRHFKQYSAPGREISLIPANFEYGLDAKNSVKSRGLGFVRDEFLQDSRQLRRVEKRNVNLRQVEIKKSKLSGVIFSLNAFFLIKLSFRLQNLELLDMERLSVQVSRFHFYQF